MHRAIKHACDHAVHHSTSKLEIDSEVDFRSFFCWRKAPMIVQMLEGPIYIGDVDRAVRWTEGHTASERLTKHFVGNENIGDDDFIVPCCSATAHADPGHPRQKLRIALNIRDKLVQLLGRVRDDAPFFVCGQGVSFW